jgi:IS4 transposase
MSFFVTASIPSDVSEWYYFRFEILNLCVFYFYYCTVRNKKPIDEAVMVLLYQLML